MPSCSTRMGWALGKEDVFKRHCGDGIKKRQSSKLYLVSYRSSGLILKKRIQSEFIVEVFTARQVRHLVRFKSTFVVRFTG